MTVVARGIYDPYVEPADAAARGLTGAGVDASKDGRTKQADLKESDINFIMKRYEKTGQVPEPFYKNPVYGDFSEVPDFQEALNIVNRARDQFYGLEASVRSKFDNDPAKFLAFVNDPNNQEELIKMGLARRLPPKSIKRLKASFKPTNEKPYADEKDYEEVFLNPKWAPVDDESWPVAADYHVDYKPV